MFSTLHPPIASDRVHRISAALHEALVNLTDVAMENFAASQSEWLRRLRTDADRDYAVCRQLSTFDCTLGSLQLTNARRS